MGFLRIGSFFKSSLKNRIVAIMVLVSILPFTGIYAYTFFSLKNNITKDYIDGTKESINNISELINRKLLEYVQKSQYITADSNIIYNLDRNFDNDIEQKAEFYVTANRLLNDIGINESGNQVKYYIYYSNKTLFNYKYFKDIREIGDSDFIRNKVLKISTQDVLWSPYVSTGLLEEKYFSLYKKIPTNTNNMCILEIQIPVSTIELYLNNLDVPKDSMVIYQDALGKRIYTTVNDYVTQKDTSGDFSNSKYFILSNALIDSHIIIAAIPKGDFYRKYKIIFLIMALIFLLVILSIYMASVLTTNVITKELKRFISDIKKDDDMLLNNTSIDITGDDEVSLIKRKFSDLVKKINGLHKENLDSFKNKKILEVELLQSKLNPHMLYNSLSVIKWRAISSDDKNTVELVDCMTKYYRSVLNKGYNIIQIKDEIKLIREYVRINEIAHAAVYNLVVDVDENIMECHIIKLLLQPIVENAISHGLNGKPGDKKITITGYISGNDIIFSIEDNGYGMKAETIEKVLKLDYKKAIGGYGIKNIISMIKIYFGEDYGIEIESGAGSFTRVLIKIPAYVDSGIIKELSR